MIEAADRSALERVFRRTWEDASHTMAQGALGGVPFGGGLLAAGFGLWITPPVMRRLETFLALVVDRLDQLRDQYAELSPQSLEQNETWVTTMLHATQIAARNHRGEKLEALRNAVVNSALPDAPDDDLQAVLLELIDRLTPRHLLLLNFLRNPPGWFADKKVSITQFSREGNMQSILDKAFPKWRREPWLTVKLINDLVRDGLVSGSPIAEDLFGKIGGFTAGGAGTPIGVIEGETYGVTQLGKRLLEFVSAPPSRDL